MCIFFFKLWELLLAPVTSWRPKASVTDHKLHWSLTESDLSLPYPHFVLPFYHFPLSHCPLWKISCSFKFFLLFMLRFLHSSPALLTIHEWPISVGKTIAFVQNSQEMPTLPWCRTAERMTGLFPLSAFPDVCFHQFKICAAASLYCETNPYCLALKQLLGRWLLHFFITPAHGLICLSESEMEIWSNFFIFFFLLAHQW